MAKTLTWGFNDTPISGITSLNLPRGIVNFDKDFAVKDNGKGECILTNLTSPLDRAETIRTAYSVVPNVYNNTQIDPKVQSPNRKGVQVLVQLNDTLTVSDSTDAAYRIDLPVQTHIVLKFPSNEMITTSVVEKHLGRVVSCLYNSGTVDGARINELLRGSVCSSEV